MRAAGLVFAISGWVLGLAALRLLTGTGARLAFVIAGLTVEWLGLGLIAWQAREQERGER